MYFTCPFLRCGQFILASDKDVAVQVRDHFRQCHTDSFPPKECHKDCHAYKNKFVLETLETSEDESRPPLSFKRKVERSCRICTLSENCEKTRETTFKECKRVNGVVWCGSPTQILDNQTRFMMSPQPHQREHNERALSTPEKLLRNTEIHTAHTALSVNANNTSTTEEELTGEISETGTVSDIPSDINAHTDTRHTDIQTAEEQNTLQSFRNPLLPMETIEIPSQTTIENHMDTDIVNKTAETDEIEREYDTLSFDTPVKSKGGVVYEGNVVGWHDKDAQEAHTVCLGMNNKVSQQLPVELQIEPHIAIHNNNNGMSTTGTNTETNKKRLQDDELKAAYQTQEGGNGNKGEVISNGVKEQHQMTTLTIVEGPQSKKKRIEPLKEQNEPGDMDNIEELTISVTSPSRKTTRTETPSREVAAIVTAKFDKNESHHVRNARKLSIAEESQVLATEKDDVSVAVKGRVMIRENSATKDLNNSAIKVSVKSATMTTTPNSVGRRRPKYECSVCKQVYSNGWNLKVHSLRHGERTQVCTYAKCNQSFYEKRELRSHLQRVHDDYSL